MRQGFLTTLPRSLRTTIKTATLVRRTKRLIICAIASYAKRAPRARF